MFDLCFDLSGNDAAELSQPLKVLLMLKGAHGLLLLCSVPLRKGAETVYSELQTSSHGESTLVQRADVGVVQVWRWLRWRPDCNQD